MPPLCILTIVVLIIVIAWALFRKTKTPTPEIHISPEVTRVVEPVVTEPEVIEPEVIEPDVIESAPTPKRKKAIKADDLTRLEGIGPKVHQVLKKAGITTFAQLASADKPKLRETLDAAGYRFMDPEGWIEQAKLAAEGKFEKLEALQGKLKGGRKAK
jgi:predicted flap endonuclease-1-like 5' DNA nuclease